MKTLAVGTQTLSIIRENDYLYVDKTKHILKMIKDGKTNFFLVNRDLESHYLTEQLKSFRKVIMH